MHIGLPEVLLIALVVLLLFGGKKIPELMKGLGKGVKSFKDGVNGLEDDIKSDSSNSNSSNTSKQNSSETSQQTSSEQKKDE